MRATVNRKEEPKKLWIFPLILFIVSICIEGFLGGYLYNASHDPILSSQNFLYKKLGLTLFNNNPQENSTIYKINYFQPLLADEEEEKDKSPSTYSYTKSDQILSEAIYIINTNSFYIILCGLLFSFVNIYKIFILSNTIFLANFISSTLCFIFHSPRPFMVYFKIKPAVAFNDWGSPNTEIVVLLSFCLSLYEVLIQNKVMINLLWGKIILGIFLGIYAFIDIFLVFASGNAAINQIIFSIFISVVTYMIIFTVFKVELNKSKQLYDFIKYKSLYYIVVNILLLSFQILLYIFIIDKSDVIYYGNNIDIQLKRLPTYDVFKRNINFLNLFYLNKGNFCNVICFLMNIISFLGMKADLRWTYDDKYNYWSEGNFEKSRIIETANTDLDASNNAEYENIEKSQWNHNGFFLGLLRFIVLAFLIVVSFMLTIYFYSLSKGGEFLAFVLLKTLPMLFVVFGIFYLYKVILTFMKLGKGRRKKHNY